MKMFVATITARSWESPLGRCVEIETTGIDADAFSLEEEEAIQSLVASGASGTELASSLAEGVLGMGATADAAKEAALVVWCKQERDLIEWHE